MARDRTSRSSGDGKWECQEEDPQFLPTLPREPPGVPQNLDMTGGLHTSPQGRRDRNAVTWAHSIEGWDLDLYGL